MSLSPLISSSYTICVIVERLYYGSSLCYEFLADSRNESLAESLLGDYFLEWRVDSSLRGGYLLYSWIAVGGENFLDSLGGLYLKLCFKGLTLTTD